MFSEVMAMDWKVFAVCLFSGVSLLNHCILSVLNNCCVISVSNLQLKYRDEMQ